MEKDDIYYEAMLARDYRFDGKFYVGVKTTGIYCRPICPARPKRENVEFFSSALAAEKAGFRPCLRCRPESAPGSPLWMGKSAMVRRAMRLISSHEVITFDEDKFAALFGVTARHLRRVFMEEIGKTPKQLAFDYRLNLARQLIVETSLPLIEVAYSAGFESVRRFNDAFKKRFKKTPSEIRRRKIPSSDGVTLSLSYRPPYDFEGLLQFYQNHRVGRLETVEDGKYTRLLSWEGKTGTVSVSNDPSRSALKVTIHFPDSSFIHSILTKVRNLFDLDSDPVVVANTLETDPDLKRMLSRHPGIRLPSGWDSFETAVSAILGQLVSVEQGRSLVEQLTALLPSGEGLFPSPREIAGSSLEGLKTTESRKETLRQFSRAVAEGKISLEATQDIDEFHRSLQKVKGIGPWTSHIMALRVLRHTDAFPATDLIIARALEKHPGLPLEKMAPWRGYVALLLWKEYARSLKKTSRP